MKSDTDFANPYERDLYAQEDRIKTLEFQCVMDAQLIQEIKAQNEIMREALRFIRSSADCRNESESEQCAHVAEEALEKVREV
jgi:hypothetical protein